MASFLDLIKYFEHLASSNVDIRHTQEEKHFFRMEIDEILAGIKRTDAKYPMLLLEGYGFGFTDNRSDNLLKNREGAFVVLDHISDKSDHDLMHQKWEQLEIIATDILLKIKSDRRNPLYPVIRNFDFESVHGSLIRNKVGNDVGIRVTYTITSPLSNDVNPDKWME